MMQQKNAGGRGRRMERAAKSSVARSREEEKRLSMLLGFERAVFCQTYRQRCRKWKEEKE